MNSERYLRCRAAHDEAREVLELVPVTHSPSVAAAACCRALTLCFMLDRELNQTAYPEDFELARAIGIFEAQYPELFPQGSVLHGEEMSQALDPGAVAVSAVMDGGPDAFENTYIPAARDIRLMLDAVVIGLRRPKRFRWRMLGIAAAIVVLLLAASTGLWWVKMMTSTEGLTVTYFRGTDLMEPVTRRVEERVLVQYGAGRPAFLVPKDRYSARWEGTLVVPATTNYAFYSQSEGGIRVFIDDDQVIDGWRERDWQTSGTHGAAFLEAGDHRIVVEYFKNVGNGALRLRWAGGPIPANEVMAVPYLKRRHRAAP